MGDAGGDEDRVARGHVDRIERVEHGVVVLRVDPVAQRGLGDVVLEADVNPRARLGGDDDPRLGLAELGAQVLAGERAVGVHVDGQALAGVQQLDQERGIGPEALDVRRSEPRLGVGGDDVAQQLPIGEAAEPELGLAEDRRRRTDPLLRHMVATEVDPAQLGDRRPTAVEARDAVGRELGDGSGHCGRTSPEPRATSSQSITCRTGSASSPSRRA